MRATIMEIDRKKFQKNMQNIQNYIGGKILMPVIKANAYGTCINKSLNLINQYEIVAVAIIDEAVQLRQMGYAKEIFVLNPPASDEIKNIIDYSITIGISDLSFARKLIESRNKVKVHLEIETGMNRTGIKLDELEGFIKEIKNTNIEVDGVYTHLSSADFDPEYTKMQLSKFKDAVEIVKNTYPGIRYIHSSASNGLLNYPEDVSNTVRPGIIMYGYESYEGVKKQINIEPIARLKTKIIHIKKVEKGEAIGYSQKFVAPNPMTIATIPIGYADGLRKELSNKGKVVINGNLVPIVGNICMDSCMIDITNIEDVNIEDDVYIWDNEVQTLEDVAELCNTINYEIMSTISARVPRVFKQNGGE